MLRSIYGRLTVITKDFYRDANGHMRALCGCSCGALREVTHGALNSGRTVSCGCYSRDRSTTHGMSKVLGFKSWQAMVARCVNPRSACYAQYGARGITVDPRWLDPVNFFEDMGVRPEGHSIDRIDNALGYSKGNCRWATRSQQNLNKRTQSNNKLGQRCISHRANKAKPFVVRVTLGGVHEYLGSYLTLAEAVAVRDVALATR